MKFAKVASMLAGLTMMAQAGMATAAAPVRASQSIAATRIGTTARAVSSTKKDSHLAGGSGGLFVGLLVAGIAAGAIIAVSRNHNHDHGASN